MNLRAKYFPSPVVPDLWCVGIYEKGREHGTLVTSWTREFDAKEQTRLLNRALSYGSRRKTS